MGIQSVLTAGMKQSLGHLKNVDFVTPLKSVGVDIPKPQMPEAIKNWEPKFDTKVIKLPAGVNSYISPLAQGLLSNIKLPEGIGGLSLPQLPDLSSVTSKIEESMSSMGLDTSKIGMNSVEDILKEPDLSSLYSVPSTLTFDVNNMPDPNSIMSEFDISGTQAQINEMSSKVPGIESIDISKYF